MMQINTGLGGMTMQTVKQLFNDRAQAASGKDQEQDPLSRIKALIAGNDGKPSYKILSEMFRLDETDQKAFAEMMGGWVAKTYSVIEGYTEFGLKDAVIGGIHQAAAAGRSWDGLVEIGGQSFGVATGVAPERVTAFAKMETDRHSQQLRETLEGLGGILQDNPEWLDALPDTLSTETAVHDPADPANTTVHFYLSELNDLGVDGLELARQSDGSFKASRFTIDWQRTTHDYNYREYDYGVTGRGTIDSWITDTALPRTDVSA